MKTANNPPPPGWGLIQYEDTILQVYIWIPIYKDYRVLWPSYIVNLYIFKVDLYIESGHWSLPMATEIILCL